MFSIVSYPVFTQARLASTAPVDTNTLERIVSIANTAQLSLTGYKDRLVAGQETYKGVADSSFRKVIDSGERIQRQIVNKLKLPPAQFPPAGLRQEILEQIEANRNQLVPSEPRKPNQK